MKKTKKVMIIVAAGFILLGLFLSVGALFSMNFDFTKLNTVTFVTNTYSVEEEFSNLSVEGAECDVRLLLSEDDSCKVVCHEGNKINHSVTVENDTLRIERQDQRKWYEHIGIYWGRMEIAIYLPRSEYDSLYIKSLSGDIEIPKEFSFEKAEIQNTSGNVHFLSAVQTELSVKTVSGELKVQGIQPNHLQVESVSGDIMVDSAHCGTELKAKTVSGDLKLTEIVCGTITAETTSGEVNFAQVDAAEKIRIESVSGDVDLRKCDAEDLWIKTTSGDVEGSLLTEKVFITDTNSGDIDVPNSVTGGKCQIKTTSGDVEISIVDF